MFDSIGSLRLSLQISSAVMFVHRQWLLWNIQEFAPLSVFASVHSIVHVFSETTLEMFFKTLKGMRPQCRNFLTLFSTRLDKYSFPLTVNSSNHCQRLTSVKFYFGLGFVFAPKLGLPKNKDMHRHDNLPGHTILQPYVAMATRKIGSYMAALYETSDP